MIIREVRKTGEEQWIQPKRECHSGMLKAASKTLKEGNGLGLT